MSVRSDLGRKHGTDRVVENLGSGIGDRWRWTGCGDMGIDRMWDIGYAVRDVCSWLSLTFIKMECGREGKGRGREKGKGKGREKGERVRQRINNIHGKRNS